MGGGDTDPRIHGVISPNPPPHPRNCNHDERSDPLVEKKTISKFHAQLMLCSAPIVDANCMHVKTRQVRLVPGPFIVYQHSIGVVSPAKKLLKRLVVVFNM
jgi:hypothetical protein